MLAADVRESYNLFMNVGVLEYRFGFSVPVSICFDQDAPDPYVSGLQSGPEPEPSLRCLLELVRKSDTFIDVGANIGQYTFPMALRGARVLAVEALTKNFSLLLMGIVKNRFENVTASHCAAGSHTGVAFMRGTSAWGQLAERGAGDEVPCSTLDDLCAAYGFWDASLLKIDVEGAELEVLEGAKVLLQSSRDVKIVFEANACAALAWKIRIEDLLSRVEALGFHLYMILDKLLVPKMAAAFQECVLVDYLAMRGDAPPKIEGFEVRPLSLDEQIQIITREATILPPAHRAYIYTMYDSRMPRHLRDHPCIISLVERLKNETDPLFWQAYESLSAFY